MPNIKAKKKNILTSEKRRVRNMSVRSRMKTMVKHAETAVEQKDAEGLKKALPEALSSIDRAASRGVIHRNSAARKKSSLQLRATSI
jgi:small subunit ribosomal protein S20